MTDPDKLAALDAQAEVIARIIDPTTWAVMDSYLEQTKRKYAGQNVGWPADQFQHKVSMGKAREIIAALRAAEQPQLRIGSLTSSRICGFHRTSPRGSLRPPPHRRPSRCRAGRRCGGTGGGAYRRLHRLGWLRNG